MTADRLYPRLPQVSFAVLLLAVYTTALLIASSGILPHHPGLAGAVTFDLTVLIPALFYLLVIRTTRLPGISLVPVFVLSLIGASLVLPSEHEFSLNLMKHLVLPAEMLLVGYVGVRVFRGVRKKAPAPTDDRVDLLERFRSSLHDLVPIPAAASGAAHEIAVLYYAFLSWRSRPDVRDGELAFSYHQRNGYSGMLLAVALAAVVEMLAIHLLIAQWSTTVAWVLTAISLYGLVWLLGHFQSVRLRPILVGPDVLYVRIGLLWSVRIPYEQIQSIRPAADTVSDRRAKGYLHAVTLGAPQLLLELHAPVEVHGPYGYTKRNVWRIGIAVDQRDRFAAELASRAGKDS